MIKSLTETLATLAELEQDATIDDGTMESQRSALVSKLVEDTVDARLPGLDFNEVARRQAIEFLLAPRRSVGTVTWNDFTKLLVRKLPGGKHYLSIQGYGSWEEHHDLYFRSVIHEADVIIYMLLITITGDNKLVQNFIGSPKAFNDFLSIFKLVCKLIAMDKKHADLGDESDSYCASLAGAIEKFTTAHSSKSSKETRKVEDANDGDEPEVERIVLDDDVINNLLSNL